MSKLFKILISLTVICLSCIAFFACSKNTPAPTSTSTPESIVQSMPESRPEDSESSPEESESEEDTESNFEVELPEVDRM